MKTLHLQTLVFCAVAGLSAATWSFFWPAAASAPAAAPPAPKPTIQQPVSLQWTETEIRSAVQACTAATVPERARAALHLGRIPVEKIPAALEVEPLLVDNRLTLAGKVLLMRWAGSDGRAAATWAWKHFRPQVEVAWDEVYGEMGSAWAWHNAPELQRWVSEAKHVGLGGLRREDAEASETPILDATQINWAIGWIAREDPRLAYELLLKHGETSFDDLELCQNFTLIQVKEALEAFPELLQEPPSQAARAQRLLRRWFELDPQDLARSPYSHLLTRNRDEVSRESLSAWKAQPEADRASKATELINAIRALESSGKVARLRSEPGQPFTLPQSFAAQIVQEWAPLDRDAAAKWLESLPEAERNHGNQTMAASMAARDLNSALTMAEKLPAFDRLSGTVRSFDAWRQANPGQRPDTTGWSEQRLQAWKDLESIAE